LRSVAGASSLPLDWRAGSAAYVRCSQGGGAVYVLGGEVGPDDEANTLDAAWCFLDRPGGGRFESVGQLPVPMALFATVALRTGGRDRLLVVGGTDVSANVQAWLQDVDGCSCASMRAEEAQPLDLPPGILPFFLRGVRLADGSALIVGGVDPARVVQGNLTGVRYAALFVPDLDWSP
jgi:hypothetical protein